MNGNIINEQLNKYNTLEELKGSESWNMAPEASLKRSFNVSNIDGNCSLNIIEEYLKKNGNGSDPKDYYIGTVNSYYYNEKTSKVISQGEYLEELGYTEDDILALFNEKYAEVYSNRTYDFSHIIFWFDGENKLQFATSIIDNMDSNTVDFALMIKEQIIALYPEIDLEEHKQLNGTEDLIILQGSNSYLYLEFHFENNIVTKIVAGTLID